MVYYIWLQEVQLNLSCQRGHQSEGGRYAIISLNFFNDLEQLSMEYSWI